MDKPNYTLQQGQVLDCIVALRMQDRVPTRALVREHAMRAAQTAMRPGEGMSPIVYSPDTGLSPRILSPSPKVHAVLWLDAMASDPPPVGILEDRIAYLQQASELTSKSAYAADQLQRASALPGINAGSLTRNQSPLRMAV